MMQEDDVDAIMVVPASSAIYVYPTVRINLPVFHVAVTLKPWFPNTKQYWQSVGDGL
jgi:hypothetical protein